jgi:hypothetical protein
MSHVLFESYIIERMPSNPNFPEWLAKLWWREAWLTLEAAEEAELPPYLGSTIRGALGHLMRAALCDGAGCGHECQLQKACRYYALFERNRDGAKPLVLLAPSPPGLEEIALGGPVNLPYRTGAPKHSETIPTLRCEAGWKFESGGKLCFGLRSIGNASNALVAIIEAISRCGLPLAGRQFRLAAAHDGAGQLLYDRRLPAVPVQIPAKRNLVVENEVAQRVRVGFLSPSVFKLDQAPTFSPEQFAARFFEHSIGRAAQMYCACTGVRPPWVDALNMRAEMISHRLFHYELPRHSFRQQKWLDFDGVVGYIEWKGEMSCGMPWARAAEVLHFGQKAVFGLGKVRVLVLE